MVTVALCAVVLSAPIQEPPARRASLTGDIKEHTVGSKILNRERKVWVWTPPGYAETNKRRFPVLYMHDGQNCFNGMTSYIPNAEWRADETADALIKAGLIEPVIIVAVSNAGAERGNEFLPTKVSRGNESMGGDADKYGRFLTDELMPLINKEYRTDPRPEKTGLIGSSFGGIITLHLGMTRPDAFRRLGVVSPSLWWDREVMLKRAEASAWPKPKGFRLWLDMGSSEGPQAIAQTRRLSEILAKKGLKPRRDYLYYEESLGEHNEPAWARRLGEIMLFLYPK